MRQEGCCLFRRRFHFQKQDKEMIGPRLGGIRKRISRDDLFKVAGSTQEYLVAKTMANEDIGQPFADFLDACTGRKNHVAGSQNRPDILKTIAIATFTKLLHGHLLVC